MAYYRCGRRMRRAKVFRSRKDKVIAGVCGGLAEHFSISSFWLRAGFILGTILSGGAAVPILYVICIFLMPAHGVAQATGATKPPPIPKQQKTRFRNRDEAMEMLKESFESIERKVRQMEDHVTSKDYVLRRKFEDL